MTASPHNVKSTRNMQYEFQDLSKMEGKIMVKVKDGLGSCMFLAEAYIGFIFFNATFKFLLNGKFHFQ